MANITDINVGAAPNDGTGDFLRNAFIKVNANEDALNADIQTRVLASQVGAAGGVASLDVNTGYVPDSQMNPKYDDVEEYGTFAALPNPGVSGKIYVVLTDAGGRNNRMYRWTGSGYVGLIADVGTTTNVPEGTNLYYTDGRMVSGLATNNADARTALSVYSKAEVDGLISSGTANALPWFAANAIPTTNRGSDIEVLGVGVMSWNTTTSRYEMVQYGMCGLQLVFVSASQLALRPMLNNLVMINGRLERLTADITIAATGLTASSGYNVYVYKNGSALALEISATARARNSDGVWIKSGDPTRTLVGKIVTGAGPSFVERLVISWYCRVPKVSASNLTSSTFANTTIAQISTSIDFLVWGDEAVEIGWQGYGSTPGNYAQYTYLSVDNSAVAEATILSASATLYGSVGGSHSVKLAEGYHTMQLRGFVSPSAVNTTISANYSVKYFG